MGFPQQTITNDNEVVAFEYKTIRRRPRWLSLARGRILQKPRNRPKCKMEISIYITNIFSIILTLSRVVLFFGRACFVQVYIVLNIYERFEPRLLQDRTKRNNKTVILRGIMETKELSRARCFS